MARIAVDSLMFWNNWCILQMAIIGVPIILHNGYGHNWWLTPMFEIPFKYEAFNHPILREQVAPWGSKLFLLSTSHPGLAAAEFVTASRRWFRDKKFGNLSNLKRWIINHTEHTCTRAYYIRVCIYIYTHTRIILVRWCILLYCI